MSNGPDFQKKEAKQSDGKRMTVRNKGKGRWKDRTLTEQLLHEHELTEFLDGRDAQDEEERRAWDCYTGNPCEMCRQIEESENE